MKMNAWSMFKSLRVKIHMKKNSVRNSWLQVSHKNWLKPICQLVCFPEMTEFDHCDSWLGPVSMGNVLDAPAYTQNLKIIPYPLYIWRLMTQIQRGIMCLLNVTLPQQLATTDNIDPRCSATARAPSTYCSGELCSHCAMTWCPLELCLSGRGPVCLVATVH